MPSIPAQCRQPPFCPSRPPQCLPTPPSLDPSADFLRRPHSRPLIPGFFLRDGALVITTCTVDLQGAVPSYH
ncbi:hypothetical protein ZIOFF_071454 [Zingiber officinale]|uniref:Uncharacterized protein n=1 Tax=Zingiber officinale TaxID=94328 RepID=A0A8J5ENN3_ZINOF|nr:hypothetical protein ZIOFF_071454 [Zingiber officinale]